MGPSKTLWGRVRNLPPRMADLLLAAVYLLECNIELTFVDAASEVAKWYDRDRRDPWQLPKV